MKELEGETVCVCVGGGVYMYGEREREGKHFSVSDFRTQWHVPIFQRIL